MPRRTPQQLIAHLEDRLATAKERARKARDHRIIVFGARFVAIFDEWDSLPAGTQDAIRNKICDGIRQAAAHQDPPPPLQVPPPLRPYQPEPAPAPAGDGDNTLRPPA